MLLLMLFVLSALFLLQQVVDASTFGLPLAVTLAQKRLLVGCTQAQIPP